MSHPTRIVRTVTHPTGAVVETTHYVHDLTPEGWAKSYHETMARGIIGQDGARTLTMLSWQRDIA